MLPRSSLSSPRQTRRTLICYTMLYYAMLCYAMLYYNITLYDIWAWVDLLMNLYFSALLWKPRLSRPRPEAGDTRAYFSGVTIMISLPTGTKTFNWLSTYLSSHPQLTLSSSNNIFALMFLLQFTIQSVFGPGAGNTFVVWFVLLNVIASFICVCRSFCLIIVYCYYCCFRVCLVNCIINIIVYIRWFAVVFCLFLCIFVSPQSLERLLFAALIVATFIQQITHIRTCHILPPSEIDLGLCLAVFAGSGGKYLFHRIGCKGRIWQLWTNDTLVGVLLPIYIYIYIYIHR